MQLAMFAMLHEMFVDQLRHKVKRGMLDAFDRGGNVNPPSIGYTLVAVTDQNGNVVIGANGKPKRRKVIDESERQHVEEAFRLFVEERWSPRQIATRFNDLTSTLR